MQQCNYHNGNSDGGNDGGVYGTDSNSSGGVDRNNGGNEKVRRTRTPPLRPSMPACLQAQHCRMRTRMTLPRMRAPRPVTVPSTNRPKPQQKAPRPLGPLNRSQPAQLATLPAHDRP